MTSRKPRARPKSTVIPALPNPKISILDNRIRPCTACNDRRYLDYTKYEIKEKLKIPQINAGNVDTTGLENYKKKSGGIITKCLELPTSRNSNLDNAPETNRKISRSRHIYDVCISYRIDDIHIASNIEHFLQSYGFRVAVCQTISRDKFDSGADLTIGEANSYKIIQSKNYLQIQCGKFMLEETRFVEEICLAVEMGIPIILAKSTLEWVNLTTLRFPLQLILAQYRKNVIDISDHHNRQKHFEFIANEISANNEFPRRIKSNLGIREFVNIDFPVKDLTPRYFWSCYMGNAKEVSWKTFFAHFFSHYANNIEGIAENDRMWLWGILKNELLTPHGTLMPKNLVSFCTDENVLIPIWAKLCRLATQLHIFGALIRIDSSTRSTFTKYFARKIQLEKMHLLISLTKDQCPNTRVSAVLTLYEMIKDQLDVGRQVYEILPCLSDEDYLVRETACRVAAVSPLFVERFRTKLIFLSRNDPTKRVRDAAVSALIITGSIESNDISSVQTLDSQTI